SVDQSLQNAAKLAAGLVHGNFSAHHVGNAEAALQLSSKRGRLKGERTKLVVRTPIGDLRAQVESRREAHRNVHHRRSKPTTLEAAPERFAGEPFGHHTPETHGGGIPLQVMIDAMFARRSSRVERGPYGAR